MKTYHVDFFVNGEEYELDVPANKTALNVIRDMPDRCQGRLRRRRVRCLRHDR